MASSTTGHHTSPMQRVTVVGAGYMGGGIAQVFALAGMQVTICDATADLAGQNHDRLIRQTEEFERSALFPPGSSATMRTNLKCADSVEEAVADAQFIEEAVVERPAIKQDVLRRVEAASPKHAIVATNTSTIPIHELADGLQRPRRFLGVHFSNPAPFIPGVEIIAHELTSESTVNLTEELVQRAGKVTARVADQAGFVLNRLQYALLREACLLVEEGVASAAEIDLIARTTFGFRLPFFGPFAIADMAGLDVYEAGFKILQHHYGDRFAPPAALADLTAAGRLGTKQGGGFVTPPGDPTPLSAYRDESYALLSGLLRELGPAPAPS